MDYLRRPVLVFLPGSLLGCPRVSIEHLEKIAGMLDMKIIHGSICSPEYITKAAADIPSGADRIIH